VSRMTTLVNHRRRNTIIGGMATLAAVTLTACGTADGEGESDGASGSADRGPVAVGVLNDYELPEVPEVGEEYKVIVVQAHQTDAFAQSAAQAIQEYGEEMGADVTVLDAGGYTEVQKQVSQIQAAVAQSPDAIVVWSTDPTAVVPALEEAAKGGAQIFGWVQQPNFDGLVSTVSADYVQDAENYSKALFDYIGGDGEVMGAFGACASQYRTDLHQGMLNALEEYPDIDLVADECTEDFDPAKTETLVTNTLTTHPELEGVVTSLVQQAVAAVTAAQAAGAGGQVTAVGEALADCGQIDMLKDGTMPIIAGMPGVYYGQLMMATVLASLEGQDVPAEQIVPINIYTQENIDEAPLELELADDFRKGC
jgi:ribose transport system substrate-binding protein